MKFGVICFETAQIWQKNREKQANSNVGVLEGVVPEAEPEISVPDIGHFPVGIGSVGLWLKNDLFFIANNSLPANLSKRLRRASGVRSRFRGYPTNSSGYCH